MIFVGQEQGKGSAEQFSSGVSQVGAIRSQPGVSSLENYTRSEVPLSMWLTHLISKSALAVGQEL